CPPSRSFNRSSTGRTVPKLGGPPMQQLAEQWDQILARQPEDWSSMNIELELLDANQSEESALVLSPLNPWHERDWRRGIFRFRAAQTFGYGTAPPLRSNSLR